MEEEYCTACEEFSEPDVVCTFRETREEPAEYEAHCIHCGAVDSFDEDVVPCDVCEEVPAMDGYDQCSKCVEEE